jgi:DNA-binding CsgD family transcriptional regulator
MGQGQPEMFADAGAERRPLLGRDRECSALEGMLTDALAGQSRVMVLRGEPGIGKSALLGHLSDRLEGWRVARAVGVESELELAHSSLHQICAPMLDQLGRLPDPQREALSTVFGLSAGPAPTRFLVALATLTLLAEVADQQPLVCIVDDAHWLDRASEQVLGFVARRLLAERVAIVCAARTGIGDHVLAGLPELPVGGLDDSDARALLLGHVHGPLDAAVCEQVIAESHGNPLALLELPRTSDVARLAGGFGLPGSQPVASKIEQSYTRRLDVLPPETRLLVVAAAADPLGDPMLLHRAVETLGIEMAAAAPAVDAGLVDVGARVEFAHPLVRSAAYRAATTHDRARVHRALAEATDARTDPDRRAWHRAHAAPGPDEAVADELERSAARAQSRGGVAAAAAFLQRAVALTANRERRAERALAAADANFQAGAFDAALGLVSTADAGPLDEFQRARAELLRGRIAFASGLTSEAPPLLLKAARQLEAYDLDLARETYLIAWNAAVTAGHLGGREILLEICTSARALPPSVGAPRPHDLLLEGVALAVTDGHAAAAPTLQRATQALAEIPLEDALRWGFMALVATALVWDFETMLAISARQARLFREAGALYPLPSTLHVLGLASAWMGDFAAATSAHAEAESVALATGNHIAPYTLLRLRALQGREAETVARIASAIEHGETQGQGLSATYAHWASAVLNNGLARYAEAAAAARRAVAIAIEPWHTMWALPELVEAAAHIGEHELAAGALEQLAGTTQPTGNDLALGIETRCRALVSGGAVAEDLYRTAIDHLGRTRLRPELARAHLVYGEWLRRAGRRFAAREQLRTAHDMLSTIGMDAFAERARRELLATGERVRRRSDDTRGQLTPQEEQIARLARDGLSNREIATMLYLSGRTVEWHLHKVFAKLGVSSRRQLGGALAGSSPAPAT